MNSSVWRIEDHSRKRQVRFAFLATIGSMFFGGIVGATIVLSFADPMSTNLDLPRWTIVVSEALILPPLLFIILRRRLPLSTTLRLQRVPFRALRDALLIGLGITVLIDELYSLVELVFPLPESVAQGMGFFTFTNSSEALLVILGAVVIAPLVEELVFRGFFQQQLEQVYRNATSAVLLSSLLFTIFHFNPWWSIQIYILGLVLGYLAWRTGSIWPPIVIHAIVNGLAVWFANLPESGFTWYTSGGHVSPLWLAAAAVLSYLGFRSLITYNPEPIPTE